MIVGTRECVPGFDESIYQPPRDHHGDGQAFGVFKATEGDGYHDPKYLAHVATADASGLPHGAYHFARPDWSDGNGYQDGRQEARLFLASIAPTCRFVTLDLEATILDAHETTQYAIGWFDEVIASGRFPLREQRVCYVGKWFTYEHAVALPERAVLWIPSYTAGYTPDVDPTRIPLPGWSSDLWPEGWAIWQYSSSGTVAGVHPVDVNVATVQWFNAVTFGRSEPIPPFPHQEDLMNTKLVYHNTDTDGYLVWEPGHPPQHVSQVLAQETVNSGQAVGNEIKDRDSVFLASLA